MAGNKQIWVSPRGSSSWGVHRPGAKRDIKVVDKQSQGFTLARKIARREGLELLMQGRDGQIKEKNSYGKDPYPPRG